MLPKPCDKIHPCYCVTHVKICVKILIFALLFSVCSGARMFYSPQMCSNDKEIHDCSFQIPFSEANSCHVYNTNVCKTYDFTSWNLKPLSKPFYEADSGYIVDIIPYAVYVHRIQKDSPISAINITLTLNKDISGFSFQMTENIRGRNACRIFDFRKTVDNISVPLTLYYDCFHLLVEKQWENVSMVFKAYPSNVELSYFVRIPPKPRKNLTSACDWKPLIMVFRGSLPKYDVQIKISKAPEILNVTRYYVILVDSSGKSLHTQFFSNMMNDMISSEFHNVDAGNYSAHVGIISKKESCIVSEIGSFYVGQEIKDYSAIIMIVLLILMVICAPILMYISCQWYIKKATPTYKPTLLFVYSYKRLHHEFLVIYSKYLENHYGMKVNMIYERSGNPKTWLEEKYTQSDIIVFVISPNLKTLDQDSTGEGEHHWIDQLAEAKALIEDSYIGKKKMCKICFCYSSREDMPKCLEHQGPFFVLPKDLDKFLCFTFKCSKKLYLLSKLFQLKHHKVLKSDVKLGSDEEIKKKLKIILKAKDSSVQKVKNINECSMFPECKLPLNAEKSESDTLDEKKIFTSSCNVLKSSSDNLLKMSPDNLLEKCDNAYSELPDQQPNFNELENDDFMRYCVRKILYSA